MNVASGSRRAALDWQRVSKAILIFLKQIDLDEDDCEEVVGTRFVVNTPLRCSKTIKHLKSDSSIVPGIP